MASFGNPIVSGVVDWKSYNATTWSIIPTGKTGAVVTGVDGCLDASLFDFVFDCFTITLLFLVVPSLLEYDSKPFIDFAFGVEETTVDNSNWFMKN
jgi:hypothetical protein